MISTSTVPSSLDLRLTAEPRRGAHVEGLVEDVGLFVLLLAQELGAARHVDVARRARAHAAARASPRAPRPSVAAWRIDVPTGTSTSPCPLNRTSAISARRLLDPFACSTLFSTRFAPSMARAIARFMRRPANAFVVASSSSMRGVDRRRIARRRGALERGARRFDRLALARLEQVARPRRAALRVAARMRARLDAVLGEPPQAPGRLRRGRARPSASARPPRRRGRTTASRSPSARCRS